MKALHAADLHLDSPLRGLARYESAPLAELRSATRRAYDNLIETALDEEVALLLLAGDIFDGDWTHYSSGVHFVTGLLKLREARIRVVAIAGNHDAASKITKTLRLPDNVTMLHSRTPQTWREEQLGVAVHGQSYAQPAITENLCVGYPAPLPGLINIGLLHTSADGRPGHEHYAPCSVETMMNRGYDYLGLGHVHTREVLCEQPPIIFPGVLQGRGIRETGPKGATLVEFEDGHLRHEHRVLDVVRWESVQVDATGALDLDDVCGRTVAAVRDAAHRADGRLLAAHLRITGSCDAHARLVTDHQRTHHEMLLAAAEGAGPQVWLQATTIETAPQSGISAGDDAVGELVAEVEEIMASETGVIELGKVLRPLADALPVSVLQEFNPSDPAVLRGLMEQVRTSLPAALTRRG